MSERIIHITEQDKVRLKEMLRSASQASAYLRDLAAELARAQVVKPEAVPPDVITMNSRVRLVDLDTGREEIFTLVFPDEAEASAGKISVLAPIGTAMLGYRVGDVFEWHVPARKRRFQVAEILYQPEAAGDYDR